MNLRPSFALSGLRFVFDSRSSTEPSDCFETILRGSGDSQDLKAPVDLGLNYRGLKVQGIAINVFISEEA